MSKSIIFTLFEHHYAYGVGALINSAVACNFKGKFIVGYKGSLPFWINQLIKRTNNYVIPHFEHLEITFLEIKSDIHLRYYKPFLFEQLLNQNKDHKIFYFDPDITIIGDWEFFEEWIDFGVSLVLDDCYPIMPYNHPLKQQWAKIYNYPVENGKDFNFYINSGFVGLTKNSINLIEYWKQNILILIEEGHILSDFKPAIKKTNTHKRLNPITGDQDILNASIIQDYGNTKLSIIGPEGMGFIQAGYVMLHNTGSKTWNKSFLKDFIVNGVKISEANYSFIKNSKFPINLYPDRLDKYILKFKLFITQVLQRIF